MTLNIPFEEISAFISARYKKDVSFSCISEDSFRASVTQKFLIKNIKIGIDLQIQEVTPDSISLCYSAGSALNMVVSGAIAFVLDNYPELRNAIIVEGKEHRITIKLNEIEKAKKILEVLTPQAVIVEQSSIAILASLRG